MRRGILVLLFIIISIKPYAQTCCTGGVPYLGVYRIPAATHRQFGFNISYSYNRNSNLVLENKQISDNTIKREVNTILFQSDYGFSDKFLVSIVIPYIIQSEQVTLLTVNEKISNNGIGDISIWSTLKGELGNSKYALSFALKTPNGGTNAADPESGIDYPLSFQTGSGSWDFIFNGYDDLPVGKKKRFYWINQVSAKINTKGNRFETHPGYRFGHVFQYFSSGSYRWIMGKYLANGFLGIAYQMRLKDEFQGGYENENTGGEWIFLNLGYNHQFNPRIGIGVSGSIPIFTKVNGLQLSTSNQLNLIIGYII